MSKKEVPIVIITGYLGSGKTTLMQNILKQENEELKIAFKKLVDRVEKAERNNKNV